MDSPLVLVVDDEPHICLLVRETLKQAGMSVRSAGDGRQALLALEEQDPALILLDVGLPDIDGFSLCQRIRELSHAPIIMLTARHRDDDVVRGFEVSEGKYVVLEKDEIKAAAGDRGKVVHIETFVDAAEIDPVLYEKAYFVGSRDDKDAYRLLHEALRRSGRAGIGRFTFHDREYLAAIRALDDVIALHTLRFHDELVPVGDVDIEAPGKGPSKAEVDMASKLVGSNESPFDATDYEDSYREAVLDLIKRKAKGEEIDLTEQEEPEHGDDLMAALKASL